eukprot:IDg17544t1
MLAAALTSWSTGVKERPPTELFLQVNIQNCISFRNNDYAVRFGIRPIEQPDEQITPRACAPCQIDARVLVALFCCVDENFVKLSQPLPVNDVHHHPVHAPLPRTKAGKATQVSFK